MPDQRPDPTAAKILDAAVGVLAEVGVKRSTIEQVATAAGVSHMTVYRRWSTKNALLLVAVRREFDRMLDAAFDGADAESPFRDRMLEAFAALVWALREHPLVIRELSTEPEVLQQLTDDSPGSALDATVALVAERLRRLPLAGAVVDHDALADVFVRLGHSLLLWERSERPLRSRADVLGYAGEALGPLVTDAAAPVERAPALTLVTDADTEPPAADPPAAAPRRRVPLVAASVAAVALFAAGAMVQPVVHNVVNTDVERTVDSSTPTPPPAPPAPAVTEPTEAPEVPVVVPPPLVTTVPAPVLETEAPTTSSAPRVNPPADIDTTTGSAAPGDAPATRQRPPLPRGPFGSVPPPRPSGQPGFPGSRPPGFGQGPGGGPGGLGSPGGAGGPHGGGAP